MLYVKDFERLLAFYRDALQCPVVGRMEGWAILNGGGCELALHAIPAAIAAGITVERPPRRRADTPYKLTFQVDDLEAARARVVALGGMTAGDTEALDPEGNVFNLRVAG